MDWLTQNWTWILVAGAFAWMMFGRRAQGGGCCGGAVGERDPRKSAEETAAPGPADQRR